LWLKQSKSNKCFGYALDQLIAPAYQVLAFQDGQLSLRYRLVGPYAPRGAASLDLRKQKIPACNAGHDSSARVEINAGASEKIDAVQRISGTGENPSLTGKNQLSFHEPGREPTRVNLMKTSVKNKICLNGYVFPDISL
jgi:hypothetical protein